MSRELDTALLRLVTQAMASGAAYYAANTHRIHLPTSLIDCFGDYPKEFLRVRSDLVAEVTKAASA